jgi:hypothetical protein
VRVVTTRVSTEAPIGFELDAALAISSHTHVKVSLCVTCVCVYVLQHDVCVRACDAKYADAISHAQYVAFDFHERCRGNQYANLDQVKKSMLCLLACRVMCMLRV